MTRTDTTFRWPGCCSGRFVGAAILALACVCSTAAGNVRAAADVGLIGISPFELTFYPHSRPQAYWEWLQKTQIARLELGAEVTDHVGISAGAMLSEAWGEAGAFYAVSGLPITARVYWDFTPNELWVRSTAYVSATYYHDNFYGDPVGPAWRPFLVLAVGATYTYYVFTARAEVLASVERSTGAALLIGVEIGGSYIFGPHHESDSEY